MLKFSTPSLSSEIIFSLPHPFPEVGSEMNLNYSIAANMPPLLPVAEQNFDATLLLWPELTWRTLPLLTVALFSDEMREAAE